MPVRQRAEEQALPWWRARERAGERAGHFDNQHLGKEYGELMATPGTGKKPNILILWGDDIGGFNISAYNLGMMG